MKRATLGVLLRELAMRADEEEEQQTALARDLSMGGVGASKKLAAAAKTISSQRAEIRDLKARLKAVANAQKSHGYYCTCTECCEARAAADLTIKNWRKP